MSGMIDRTTWQGKFAILSPWLFDIIHAIKRDCKSEHLRLDPSFVKVHFSGLPMHRIGTKEMRDIYGQQILTGNDRIAEFIANRWMFRHMNVYRFFETALAIMSNVSLINARILIHDGGMLGLEPLYGKSGLPAGLLPIIRVALEVVHEIVFTGDKHDRERYRARVIERILTQVQDIDGSELDYLLRKLGDVIQVSVS